jgi:hypothetical protein
MRNRAPAKSINRPAMNHQLASGLTIASSTGSLFNTQNG